jgi:hypothetical protein
MKPREANSPARRGYYLYGVMDSASRPGAFQGVNDSRVHRIQVGGLAVLLSKAPELAGRPVESMALRHDAALRHAMRFGDVVPFRFGTILPCLGDAIRTISDNRGHLHESLERIRECVEYGVRFVLESAPGEEPAPARAHCGEVPPVGRGTDYMRRKLALQRREDFSRSFALESVREIDEILIPLSREHETASPPGKPTVVKVSYLVEKDSAPDFEEVLRGLPARFPTARLVATGPWPPYHFVEWEPRS